MPLRVIVSCPIIRRPFAHEWPASQRGPVTTNRCHKRHRQDQQGFAVVAVLMITLLVFLTASMTLKQSLDGRSASVRSGKTLVASNVTEAALDFGVAALNATIPTGANTALVSLPAYFVQGTGSDVGTWTYGDGTNSGFFRSSFDGNVPTLTIRIPTTVPVPGGAGVAGDYRIVHAEATVAGALKREEAIVYLRTTTVDNPTSVFKRAITTRGDMTVNGNSGTLRTDSYDSSLGGYGGANVGNNGGVLSDGSISGGGVYHGNVSAVGTIDPSLSVQGPGNQLTANAQAETIPDPPSAPAPTRTVSTGSLPLTVTPSAGEVINLGAVSISGNSGNVLSLNPGKYIMSSLSTSGNASIQVVGNGLVEIWVQGNIDIKGNGLVNSSLKPTNLKLMETNTSATVSVAGNGNFYGALQAPANSVTLGGNGAFFGAVVANGFTFNGSNAEVHYDDAVGRAFATSGTITRGSRWQVLTINVMDRSN